MQSEESRVFISKFILNFLHSLCNADITFILFCSEVKRPFIPVQRCTNFLFKVFIAKKIKTDKSTLVS